MARLSGKIAIVTGAGQGIGFAIAKAIAREGGRVIVADLDADKARSAADEINRDVSPGAQMASAVHVDIASKASVDAMVATVVEQCGTVDVLVNNAAVWKSSARRPFWEIPTSEWDQVLAINTRGAFYCCSAVAPVMLRNAQGRIIFVGSSTIGTAQATLTHYTTSKAALIGLYALRRA